jgi:hypothetical protein
MRGSLGRKVVELTAEGAFGLLAILLVWGLQTTTAYVLGEQGSIFGAIRLEWLFDGAHFVVIITILLRMVSASLHEFYDVAFQLTRGIRKTFRMVPDAVMSFAMLAFARPVLQAVAARVKGDSSTAKEQVITIAGLLVARRAKRNIGVYLLLLLAFAVNTISARMAPSSANLVFAVVIVLLIAARWCSQWLLAYRLRKGYFGNRYSEAHEIVLYLLEHSVPVDYVKQNGWPAVLPAPEQVAASWSMDVVTAGESL